ncbi:MAG: hypothetical protein M5U12_20230 [Verrucomicrobia bacterium]|nr:hypothetical protein [Verrucomicrobiota bacterium]
MLVATLAHPSARHCGTATHLTLRQAYGQDPVLPRHGIARMTRGGRSILPISSSSSSRPARKHSGEDELSRS